MKKLRQINKRNQITLPPQMLEKLSLKPGDYVEISSDNGSITITSVRIESSKLSGDDLTKIERLFRRQVKKKEYKEYSTPKAALSHLDSLKKSRD